MIDKGRFQDLGLEGDTAERLAEIANFGLSKSSWSNYKTAERMLMKCRKQTRKRLELPMDQKDILTFVEWLARERKVKHGTICSYLAGLRQLHLLKGHDEMKIRTDLVNLVLTGQKNKEAAEEKGEKGGRLPVTVTVMKLIKATLRESEMKGVEKLLVWAVCCIAFAGAFRIHELLCREETKFNPRFTLLEEDIVVAEGSQGKKSLFITVKWPKEDKKGKGVEVEVMESGTAICPVKAYLKWRNVRTETSKGMPAFRQESGKPLTGQKLNNILRELLEEHISYETGTISTHSFRSGVTTALGQKGLSDDQLKEAGRWSSRAFEHYVKLPRTRRKGVAKIIGQIEDDENGVTTSGRP